MMEYKMYNNSIKLDAVYHNECSCLFAQNVEDEKCLKRFYHLYDYKKNCFVKLFICNETIRLKLNQRRIKLDSEYISEYQIDQVLIDIFEQYVFINNGWENKMNNDLLSKPINITICSRPFVWFQLNIVDAIEKYLENGSIILYDKISNHILSYMESITYKKYKSKYEFIRKKLNKMKYMYGDEKSILMNEIFVEILQTQYKLKK